MTPKSEMRAVRALEGALTDQELVERAQRVNRAEAEGLLYLADRIGDDFIEAVETITRACGRVFVSGIGKSGIIGRKIATTMTSNESPAVFLQPFEGLHGELG